MSEMIDPGEGYRLLEDHEIIQQGDERTEGYYSAPRVWFRVRAGIGQTVAQYRAEHSALGIVAVRRRIDTEHPLMASTDAAETATIVSLRAENATLRQKLADAQNDNNLIRNTNICLQTDLDAASKALNDLGCAQGEIDNDIGQCIRDLAERWRIEITEQRACEILTRGLRVAYGPLDITIQRWAMTHE